MTKTIAENIRYIDNEYDAVNSNIDEVRSSISYELNTTTKNFLRSNGTLQSLLEAGVKFISLNTRSTNYIDEYGNTQFAQGTFTKTDGRVNEYGEFNLVRRLGFNPTLKIRGIQNRNKSAA